MLKKIFEYIKLLRYMPIHFPRMYVHSSYSSKKRKNGQIEPVVMQTWVNNRLGWLHYYSWKKFRNINYDLDFIFFSDLYADRYMSSNWRDSKIYQIYINSRCGPAKADIFRYCYIYDNGGYYFDIKSGCSVSMSKSHNTSQDSFLFFENNISILPSGINKDIPYRQNIVAQWAFGFKKRHPFLKFLINNIENFNFSAVEYLSVKDFTLVSTGPGMFTHSVVEYINSEDDLFFNNIDINGTGKYTLKGSGSRYLEQESYVKDR